MATTDEQFTAYRPLLFSIAYRMLGTVTDAEDMIQETYLRWQRSLAVGGGPPAAAKGWLTTVLTRLCIDQLRSARARREEYVGPWLPEPLLTDGATDGVGDPAEEVALAESLSLAFLALLERLNPIERAVFLLHDVFGYDFAEIAPIVGKEAANCRQLGARARAHIAAARPRFAPDPDERERLTSQFIATCASGDLPGLVATLAEDITLWSDGGGKATAARKPIEGADKVARFMIGVVRKAAAGFTYEVTAVNGQPGIVARVGGHAITVVALDIAGGRIAGIALVANPDKLAHLDVPPDAAETARATPPLG